MNERDDWKQVPEDELLEALESLNRMLASLSRPPTTES